MRETKYYFGRTATDDYIAYEVGHIFLHGASQFYLDAYVDSFLLKLIEETIPSDASIILHNCQTEDSMWADKYIKDLGWKGIANIDGVYTSKKQSLADTLGMMVSECNTRLSDTSDTKKKNIFIILRDYDTEVSDLFYEHLEYLLKFGKEAKMYVILTSYGQTPVNIKPEFLPMFDYVMSTTNTEENSKLLFGTADASNTMIPAFGYIVIKYAEDIVRFHSLFYPYTFIKKVIRSLSVVKDKYYVKEKES